MTFDEIIPLMPPFQAVMNAVATILLSAGYYYIRSGNRAMHRNCMAVTLVISSVFLVSYLTSGTSRSPGRG